RLARLVIELLHRMTIKDVAHYLGLSWDTVKDIHKNYLNHKFSGSSDKSCDFVIMQIEKS
ncbi:transposase family protein, partial [Prevotella lacticifex]|uniref:transposase family protein n=1 Tax=Prevotella lacticifex TaxID=2854755 RepID=UPI001CC50D9E